MSHTKQARTLIAALIVSAISISASAADIKAADTRLQVTPAATKASAAVTVVKSKIRENFEDLTFFSDGGYINPSAKQGDADYMTARFRGVYWIKNAAGSPAVDGCRTNVEVRSEGGQLLWSENQSSYAHHLPVAQMGYGDAKLILKPGTYTVAVVAANVPGNTCEGQAKAKVVVKGIYTDVYK